MIVGKMRKKNTDEKKTKKREKHIVSTTTWYKFDYHHPKSELAEDFFKGAEAILHRLCHVENMFQRQPLPRAPFIINISSDESS